MVEQLTRLETSDNREDKDGMDGAETSSEEEFIEDAEGGDMLRMSKFIDGCRYIFMVNLNIYYFIYIPHVDAASNGC